MILLCWRIKYDDDDDNYWHWLRYQVTDRRCIFVVERSCWVPRATVSRGCVVCRSLRLATATSSYLTMIGFTLTSARRSTSPTFHSRTQDSIRVSSTASNRPPTCWRSRTRKTREGYVHKTSNGKIKNGGVLKRHRSFPVHCVTSTDGHYLLACQMMHKDSLYCIILIFNSYIVSKYIHKIANNRHCHLR